MKLNNWIPISLTACLFACSPQNNEPKETLTTGKVIDGYVSGATVFLDLNYNNLWDTQEPKTISTSGGDYSLSLSEDQSECLAYSPIVVDVPVGAIDEDLGTVTKAYQMVLPPSFDENADSSNRHVTPLTSLIWQSVVSDKKGKVNLTCKTVRENPSLVSATIDTLDNIIERTVRHYNLSEAQLFGDFVANGDTEAYDAAQDIVTALKQSYADTQTLKSQNPDALFASVLYHRSDYRDGGDDQYTDQWYKETYLRTGSIDRFQLDKVNATLDETIKTIIFGNQTHSTYGAFLVSESFEYESRGGDGSAYTCDSKERLSTSADGIEYELVNLVSKQAQQYADCVVTDFSIDASGRYAFVDYQENGHDYSTQYFFDAEANYPFLDNWVNFNDLENIVDFSILVSTLGTLTYHFTDTETGSADWWVKSDTYQDGDNSIRITQNNDSEWTRTTTFANGTSLTECGTDGTTWSNCAE